jgi:hypothetical protein
MAKQTSLFLHTGANCDGTTFTSADTTALKDIFTAGANDSDVKALSICSDDTATVNMQLWYFDGATAFLIGTVRAVTLSGTDGAANAVDLLNSTALPFLPVDDAGKRYIPVKTGHKIQASCKATMTAAKTVWIVALGYDY